MRLEQRIEACVLALKQGKPILMLDDDNRENEGDLIVAAELIESESMNFLIKKGSGVVCLALAPELLDKLAIPLMIPHNTNVFQTAFTVSIEASSGVSTGVSAKDRTHTVRTAMADDARPSDLARPGHLFPLAARREGVFARMGHTEGSVDLMRIAGLKPGAVLCELMNEDGSMTVGRARKDFAENYNMPLISVDDILFYRIKTEDIFTNIENFVCSSAFGDIKYERISLSDGQIISLFSKNKNIKENLSLDIVIADNILQRYISQVLQSLSDDPLHAALEKLKNNQSDAVVLIHKNSDNLKSQEAQKRLFAALCRYLNDSGHQAVKINKNLSEFITIANNFFPNVLSI